MIRVEPSDLRKHALIRPSEAGIDACAAGIPARSARAVPPPKSSLFFLDFRGPDLRSLRVDMSDPFPEAFDVNRGQSTHGDRQRESPENGAGGEGVRAHAGDFPQDVRPAKPLTVADSRRRQLPPMPYFVMIPTKTKKMT
jgi:hypothetical protein